MQNFLNETIDLALLPKYENIELDKPHANYWKIIIINICIALGLTGIGVIVFMLFKPEFRTNLTLFVGIYVILAVSLVVLFRLSFKNRGYAFRNHDVIYKSGIIVESTTIVPLNRIQHIELNEGILSRMYQLGSLQIFSAGGQTGHIRIAGIPIEVARRIRDLILRRLDSNEQVITEEV